MGFKTRGPQEVRRRREKLSENERDREEEWIPSQFFALTFVHFPGKRPVFVVHGPPPIWWTFFKISHLKTERMHTNISA